MSDEQLASDVSATMAGTIGQWIEAIDAPTAQGQRVILSRGWTMMGAPLLGGAPLDVDDSRLVGTIITSSTAAATGSLTWQLADADDATQTRREVIATPAPWALTALEGLAVAARPGGSVGLQPATGRAVATDARMSAWRHAEIAPADLEVLESATDDWVSPADVWSALLDSGVTEGHEVARHSVDLLGRLVARGDLVVGSITDDGFQPSADDPAADLEMIATLWGMLAPRIPGPGQIAWFDITGRGRQRLAESGWSSE